MSWKKCEDFCKYAPQTIGKWPCRDCFGQNKAEPMERKLWTWDEYKRKHENTSTWENWETRDIECPVCGEAIEERTDIAYTSDIANFPLSEFRCTKCGWHDRAKMRVYFAG